MQKMTSKIQCKIYQGNVVCLQIGSRYGNCPGSTDGVYEEIRQTSKGNLTNMLKEEGKKKPSEG